MPDDDLEAIREGVRGSARSSTTTTGATATQRPRVPVGLLRGDGRGRLGRHRHPRGVRRRRPGHHRGVDRAGGGGRVGRGDERLHRAIHLSIFGMNPVVQARHRRDARRRTCRAVASGELHVAFGVTEPDAGTDTTRITTRAAPRRRPLHRAGPQGLDDEGARLREGAAARAHDAARGVRSAAPTGMTLLLADLQRPEVDIAPDPEGRPQRGRVVRGALRRPRPCRSTDRVGEEGEGFRYLLDGLNPERILVAVEALGIGQVAHPPGRRATPTSASCSAGRSARTRASPSRWPRRYAQLHAAELVDPRGGVALRPRAAVRRAGQHRPSTSPPTPASTPPTGPCRPTAASATPPSTTSSATGARRGSCSIAPITQEMVLNYVAEHVLGLPRSY